MKRPLFAAGLLLAAVMAVCLSSGVLSKSPDGKKAAKPPEGEVVVSGRVCQKDENSFFINSVNSVILYQENQEAAIQQHENSNQKIICEVESAEEIPMGSLVAVRGQFASFSESTNPGEFDSAVYYRSIGVGGKLKKAEILSWEAPRIPLREGLYRLRCFWQEKLYAVFPEKEAAVMSALLLGERSDLDSELKNLYKRNGILHILSISSLHITILGMGLYRLLRRMGMPTGAAAFTGGMAMIFYCLLTGFGVSVCRAVGMYLLHMLAESVGRTYDMLNSLGAVGICMLLYRPWYLENSGFLLSFSAILGIGVVYPAFCRIQGERLPERRYGESIVRKVWRRIWKNLRESALLSTAITLTTLPIQLWFFYEVPVFGVLINLFVLPLVKPLLLAGLLVLVLPVPQVAAWMDWLILWWYEALCGFFDGLPFGIWNPGRPQGWQVFVYYVVLIGCVWWGRRSCTGGKKAAVTLSLFAAVLVLGSGQRPKDEITFLDVGQGDCAVVRTAAGQTYLFDCGSSSRKNVGKYALLPFLKYSGIREIDGVFLSHPDTDHVNGALELFSLAEENRIQISQLVLPELTAADREAEFGELIQAAERINIRYLAAGDSWKIGDAEFVCLHPSAGYSGADSNEYSMCVLASFGKESGAKMTVLFTGDAEGAGETKMRQELVRYGVENLTVLKVAHHGSRNATSEEFLEQINPALAVISCGERNRYGHPHEEVLTRLEESGAWILQTPESGAVTVRMCGKEVRVREFSKEFR